MNNKITNILWGLVLVAVGLILGLNALEITDINLFFDGWWTLFIIVPCFIGLFRDSNKTFNLIGCGVGVFLLLACQDLIDFEILMKLMVPAILVVLGLAFIFKDFLGGKAAKKIRSFKKSDREICATFSEQNVDFGGEVFDGCTLSGIFGSVNCNLKNVIMTADCAVHASAIFGGVTIHVPDNVNVKVAATPIFGGVSDKRASKVIDAPVTLYINATCLFGGIDIK